MDVGWMRMTGFRASQEIREWVRQTDDIGVRHIHLPHLSLNVLNDWSNAGSATLYVNARTLPKTAPRALAQLLKDSCHDMQGRFGLILSRGSSRPDWAINEALEALLADSCTPALHTDMPIQPRPQVLEVGESNLAPDMRRAAGNGFDAMSPWWRTPSALARDWTDIVLGATHATRRARLRQWHVARAVYINEDRAAAAAYLAHLSRLYPTFDTAKHAITGPAEHVAKQILTLRKRVGAFGVLQVIDPGLDPAEARTQQRRLMGDVLPRIDDSKITPEFELEQS